VGHPPPRYPIEIVRRPAPARIGGRVVDASPEGIFVRDVTGFLRVNLLPPYAVPEPGTWVVAGGTWNGERIVDGVAETLSGPTGPFPRPGGEWTWLQEAQGRRIDLLRQRSQVLRAVREFFDQRAFIEVETPLMVPSPGLDLHLDAFEVGGTTEPRWLITSPEYQMKRLLAGGMPRVYQLCRCFRRNELGALHQPEFTMLEWYRAFSGSVEVMRDTEALVAHVASQLHDGSTILPARGRPVDVAPPWDRVTVREAFAQHTSHRADDLLEDEETFFRVWVDEIEPHLGRHRPVFVTHWPAQMASLARLDPYDPTVADRVEAYVDGIELCNGFGELIDPVEQRERLVRDQREREVQGKPIYPIDDKFLSALEEGLPPCAGNALGIDRLVMLVLGVTHIDDVVSIPASRL